MPGQRHVIAAIRPFIAGTAAQPIERLPFGCVAMAPGRFVRHSQTAPQLAAHVGGTRWTGNRMMARVIYPERQVTGSFAL